jgi:hypothetical protein
MVEGMCIALVLVAPCNSHSPQMLNLCALW